MGRLACILAAAAISVATAAPAVAHDGDNDYGNDHRRSARLEGVWHISGQPVNCLTGAPVPVSPITGIIAFHEGGTSTEAGPTATPRTPGLGTWYRTGGRSFSATATVLNYDVNGFSTGSLVVRRKIKVAHDGQSLTAETQTTITDASGVSSLRCAFATGTRAAE